MPPTRALLVALILPLLLLASTSGAQPAFVAGEVIVKYRLGATAPERAETRAFLAGARRFRRLELIGADALRFSEPSTDQALAVLRADPAVEYAEPNYLVYADVTPDDPQFPQQYALHNTGQGGGYAGDDIHAPEAWALGTGDPSLLIGVIDTGIDYTHPDLAANVWVNPGEVANNHKDDDGNGFVDDVHGWDFVNGDNDPMDDGFHGTHVAGTIGAVGNNAVGISGVVWRCKLVALKFMNASGIGTEADAISCIEYATAMGIRVTNNSWGNMPSSSAMQDAIAAAGAAGQLLIFAAGNNRRNNDLVPDYPSCYDSPFILSVAATDARDLLATFSNYGPLTVDLGAPGWSILSTVPGGLYATKDGTSMAAPHVTGVAALALARFPTASPLWIRRLILASVDPIPSLVGRCVTEGRLDAFKTLSNGDALVGVMGEAASTSLRIVPNPTSGPIVLTLSLPARSVVAASVFDLQGRRVRALPEATLEPGIQRVVWEGADDGGRRVRPGVYLVRVETSSATRVVRVVVRD